MPLTSGAFPREPRALPRDGSACAAHAFRMKRNALALAASLFAALVLGACATSSRVEPPSVVVKVSQPSDAFVQRNYAKADRAVECARLNQKVCAPPIFPIAGR